MASSNHPTKPEGIDLDDDVWERLGEEERALTSSAAPLLAEHSDLETKMSDPEVISDQKKARKFGRRYAELGRVTAAYRRFIAAVADLQAGRDLAETDPEFESEIEALKEEADAATEVLREVLLPRDPDDGNDVIMEIKAGEGGQESALFAADLARMYLRYAERKGWKSEIMNETWSDLDGYKDVTIAIRTPGAVPPEEGVWAHLKYEGGVHRVQRVPVTESQGRIHTSAAGVLVLPELEDEGEIEIDDNDLRIDVYRSSGPGGQSVNTTDSAVRITHVPTGVVVSMQNEKSQIQNREAAMRVLKARLAQLRQDEADAAAAEARRSQVRTVDRSERIRTYNFPENRIADHRTGFKAYNLDTVLDGDLDAVIASAISLDEAHRLSQGI
ncbi:MAG: peptide chain release factor 1 [Bowdeniella nasicola]|nr:peptide chain release factor 1 [Bowdeniella nasicola]